MRIVNVVAAMLFGKPVVAQGVKLPSVTNSIGMELLEIPAGKFTMGSPAGEKDREANEAQVTVMLTKPFWLGKTEVTQGQWRQVMGTEPWKGKDAVKADKDCPATYVTWDEAKTFCQKLTDLERKAGELKAGESYHLPTEAQREYACRAGTTTTYSFGDYEKQLGQYAWFKGNTAREQYAHAVGMKKPNPWGLYDMHGNVWEWCSDWVATLQGGTDPVGPKGGSERVARGGGWREVPGFCRSARRNGSALGDRYASLGLRVARIQSAQFEGVVPPPLPPAPVSEPGPAVIPAPIAPPPFPPSPPSPPLPPESEIRSTLRVELVSESGKTLMCKIRTDVGKHICGPLGEDAKFMSDVQFTVETDATGTSWVLSHNAKAKNQTLVNGAFQVGPTVLKDGDVVSVGNAAKGIIKLPMTVRLSRGS